MQANVVDVGSFNLILQHHQGKALALARSARVS